MGDIRTKTHGAISHTAPELLLDGLLSKAADVRGWGREGFVCGGGADLLLLLLLLLLDGLILKAAWV